MSALPRPAAALLEQASALAPLEPRLAALRRSAPTRLGPEVLAIFEHVIQRTLRSGLGVEAPAVGAVPPPVALYDTGGHPVTLADLRADGPLVLTFFRGDWCAYCREALAALRDALPDITAAGARLVAVSPQVPAANAATAERLTLPFPLLSDPGNGTAAAWGIAQDLDPTMRRLFLELRRDLPACNGDDSWRLPLPATFIIGRDGRITWRFVHGDYSRRAEPAAIVAELRRRTTPA